MAKPISPKHDQNKQANTRTARPQDTTREEPQDYTSRDYKTQQDRANKTAGDERNNPMSRGQQPAQSGRKPDVNVKAGKGANAQYGKDAKQVNQAGPKNKSW